MTDKPPSSLTPKDYVTVRRMAVVEMRKQGKTDPRAIAAELTTRGIANPVTGKPYTPTTIRADMRATATPQAVSELIGRWTLVKPLWNARVLINVDATWQDYIFLDAFRRGKALGWEFGGLFATPIAQIIASYAFGKGISAMLVEGTIPDDNSKKGKAQSVAAGTNAPNQVDYTNTAIRDMMERMQGFLLGNVVDTYCLGDAYIVINPDCTFNVLSPETVTVDYSASDYRRAVRVIVRNKLQGATVIETFTDTVRTRDIQYFGSRESIHEEYENLIGRIPIIHWSNDRETNEIWGRPLYDALFPLFARFDDLLVKAMDGVNTLGNPFPIFEGMKDAEATIRYNSDIEKYTDENGQIQTRYNLRLDRNGAFFLGEGGKFHLAGPPVGFTQDSIAVLRQLFLLMLDHCRVPEFLWGGAIASSKASAETQLPPFIQYVQSRRLQLEGEGTDTQLGIPARGGILELLDVWLRTYKLLNPAIVVAPCKIDWPGIELQNDAVKFTWGQLLSQSGYITPEDTIRLSGLFDNPEIVAQKAAGQNPQRPDFDAFNRKLDTAIMDNFREVPDDGSNANGIPLAPDVDTTAPGDKASLFNDQFRIAGSTNWWPYP